jgi:L-galactose dehydrogenase
MKYNRLGETNLIVSQIGFGGSVFSNFYKDSEYERLNETSLKRAKLLLKHAFDNGINYIDTAPWYQYSEYVLGKVLEEHTRSSYFIGTKVGRSNSDKPAKDWFNFSYKRVKESVENSLKLLGCEYIDLIQVKFEFIFSIIKNLFKYYN